jgi:ATP-binding cassette subfamily B protein
VAKIPSNKTPSNKDDEKSLADKDPLRPHAATAANAAKASAHESDDGDDDDEDWDDDDDDEELVVFTAREAAGAFATVTRFVRP